MKLLSTIVIVMMNVGLFAQAMKIEGEIRDENGALPFATVIVDPGNKGISADENGRYTVEGLTAGEYTLVASFVGYVPVKKKVTLVEGQTIQQDFSLKASVLVDEVVVTGTMKPTYVAASPIKVDVVTSKQLDTYIPAAASSIVEGVQLVNGVQEVVACGVCYTNNISINGLEGAYTAILMDGTPIYGNLASVYGLNGIPNMIIDRFEVIKGPSSTLYGSEAVAGVINIITKNPEKQPLLSVDMMGSSHMEGFGNMSVAPRIGKTYGFIGANVAYLNNFEDNNLDGFGDGVLMDRVSLFSKWNIHRKSGKKFSLAAKYYYEDRRNGVEAFLKDRAYRELRGNDSIYGESIYTTRTELFGTYEFDTKPHLKLDFSMSNHLQDSYYGSDYYKATQQIAFANFLWDFKKNNHDVLVGATARLQAYDDNSVATETVSNEGEVVNKPDNQAIPGVFIQDEWTASDRWTLLGGLRLDYYSSHKPIFAPRLSAKYKPTEWTTLRSNFGTGFRIVNLFTEDHAFVTGQRVVEIKEALSPEESYNGSLNFNHIFATERGSGSIDIEAYYTYFVNKIIPDYDTPGKIIYENSEGHARTMGIGATIEHRFGIPLGISIGGNLQRAVETEPDENGNPITTDIQFAPKWSGVTTINYEWKKKKIAFAYTATYTGHMALPEVADLDANGEPLETVRSTTSKPFSRHNLQITKTFNDYWKVYGGIQNLLNFIQTESPLVGYNDPNAQPGFSNYFDTSYAYAPNHGREFYVGVKWNLGRKKKE